MDHSHETAPFARVEQARRLLAQARTVDEVKNVCDQAAAAPLYAKGAGHSREIFGYASEIKVRAEHKAGELLAAMPKNEGTRGQLAGRDISRDYVKESPEDQPPALRELGITPRPSMDWQEVARMPEPVFEAAVRVAP